MQTVALYLVVVAQLAQQVAEVDIYHVVFRGTVTDGQTGVFFGHIAGVEARGHEGGMRRLPGNSGLRHGGKRLLVVIAGVPSGVWRMDGRAAVGPGYQVGSLAVINQLEVTVGDGKVIIGHVHGFGFVNLAHGDGDGLRVAHQRKGMLHIAVGGHVDGFRAHGMPQGVQRLLLVLHHGPSGVHFISFQRHGEVVHRVARHRRFPHEVGTRPGLHALERTLLRQRQELVVAFGQVDVHAVRLRAADVGVDVGGDKPPLLVVDKHAHAAHMLHHVGTLQVIVILEGKPDAVLATVPVLVNPVGTRGQQADQAHGRTKSM